jgi:undecaprenyl phosphate-alpha-L-ara4FN deformylase
MILGLRIDVCTYEGLRSGVPNLLPLLAGFGVRASFFVAFGPDRSGRAIRQALRPGFLSKMRRTRALRLYGWRTLLSGTLLPARRAADLPDALRAIGGAGHELALHGYDHRRWQDRVASMAERDVRQDMTQALAVCERVTGRRPVGFGAPGWQCSPTSLRLVDEIGFDYASDTRGRRPFFPSVEGVRLRTLQLPTTLPTLDEVLGLDGTDGEGFVALVSRALDAAPWPVLTLHAEAEGGCFLGVTRRLLARLAAEGVRCRPLSEVVALVRAASGDRIPVAEIVQRPIRGRAGRVAMPAGLEPSR